MSADLALQIALRQRLVASPEVTALVPEEAILDRNATPAPRPSIVLGESQIVDTNATLARSRERIAHTVHVWKTELSREGVKRIMAAIRSAIMSARFDLGPGYHCADWRVTTMRALSDPDGKTSHGVVTVECLVEEVAS